MSEFWLGFLVCLGTESAIGFIIFIIFYIVGKNLSDGQ